ncbi:MAG: hypothetical protein KF787_04460 [Phycisphaeraceae bacterium]|nr:hypothetical protein [Phycisphaeraceae bacterium]HRJ49833.1 GC-type dockerin domain-anchored protein [Phycisphaerales bacterium]
MRLALAMSLLVLSALARVNHAQCPSAWLPAHDGPGLNGYARAIAQWDPDGPGPRPLLPVVAGQFALSGPGPSRNIALWSEDAWLPLGEGTAGGALNGQVSALAVLPGGDLVAAGLFTTAGNVSAINIARFDGAHWHPMGHGLDGAGSNLGGVRALLVLPGGDLLAGGDFTHSGPTQVLRIARWNGSEWLPVGGGMTRETGMIYTPAVFALAITPGGEVIAGGQWTHAGGAPCFNIARWDGYAWNPMHSGTNAYVTALAVLPSGEVVAGGEFSLAGGVPATRLARWNGAWSSMGAGVDATVRGIDLDSTGSPVAVGFFTRSGSVVVNRTARWDGSAWVPMGLGASDTALAVRLLACGEIAVGGVFATVGGLPAKGLGRWSDQTPWLTLHPDPAETPCGTSANFSVALAPGFVDPAFEWRRDGVPIDASLNPSAATAALSLSAVTAADAGDYDCRVTTPCGEVISDPAVLAVIDVDGCFCPADFDRSGFVDIEDFTAFVLAFEEGVDEADFDGSGFVDTDDFDAFVLAFIAGC